MSCKILDFYLCLFRTWRFRLSFLVNVAEQISQVNFFSASVVFGFWSLRVSGNDPIIDLWGTKCPRFCPRFCHTYQHNFLIG